MHRTLLIALLAALHAATPAAAQWPVVSETDTTAVLLVDVGAEDAPEPGTRPAARLRGTMHRIGSDTLYLRSPGDRLLAVPRIRILNVEESLGVSRVASARSRAYDLASAVGLLLLAADDLGVEIGWWRGGTIVAAAGLAGGAWGALRPWERSEHVWLPEVNER